MTTTQSPATDPRHKRNATDRTTERVDQGAHEVTERTDQMVQQLPTVDLAQGVQRYFEFAQKAVDINRELATNWADAMTSLTSAVREQTDKAGRLLSVPTRTTSV